MGVPVSKMPGSIEALCQASLKTAKDPVRGPYPAYPSGKSWYEASGKTGSGKKFDHNVISGADISAQPYYVAIITPVIHYCMGGLETEIKFHQCWVRSPSPFLPSTQLERLQEVYTGNNRLGGNSRLDCMVFGRVVGSGMCAAHAGRSLAALAGGGKG